MARSCHCGCRILYYRSIHTITLTPPLGLHAGDRLVLYVYTTVFYKNYILRPIFVVMLKDGKTVINYTVAVNFISLKKEV
jgi:hypothetical protein